MSTHLVFRESGAALPSARHPWAPRSADQIETWVLFRSPATNPAPAFFAFARHASPTKRKRRTVHLMSFISRALVGARISRLGPGPQRRRTGHLAGVRRRCGHQRIPWLLPYVLTSFEVAQFVVPLRGRMQTLSRVLNPSDVTPSTGDSLTHFHTLLRLQGHVELYRKRSGPGDHSHAPSFACRTEAIARIRSASFVIVEELLNARGRISGAAAPRMTARRAAGAAPKSRRSRHPHSAACGTCSSRESCERGRL